MTLSQDLSESDKAVIFIRGLQSFMESKKVCSKCGKENRYDDKFCLKCGEQLHSSSITMEGIQGRLDIKQSSIQFRSPIYEKLMKKYFIQYSSSENPKRILEYDLETLLRKGMNLNSAIAHLLEETDRWKFTDSQKKILDFLDVSKLTSYYLELTLNSINNVDVVEGENGTSFTDKKILLIPYTKENGDRGEFLFYVKRPEVWRDLINRSRTFHSFSEPVGDLSKDIEIRKKLTDREKVLNKKVYDIDAKLIGEVSGFAYSIKGIGLILKYRKKELIIQHDFIRQIGDIIYVEKSSRALQEKKSSEYYSLEEIAGKKVFDKAKMIGVVEDIIHTGEGVSLIIQNDDQKEEIDFNRVKDLGDIIYLWEEAADNFIPCTRCGYKNPLAAQACIKCKEQLDLGTKPY